LYGALKARRTSRDLGQVLLPQAGNTTLKHSAYQLINESDPLVRVVLDPTFKNLIPNLEAKLIACFLEHLD
jgi:hypothetical protein